VLYIQGTVSVMTDHTISDCTKYNCDFCIFGNFMDMACFLIRLDHLGKEVPHFFYQLIDSLLVEGLKYAMLNLVSHVQAGLKCISVFVCITKEPCDFRRETKIAELIMSSTVYEDLLTKVNRGRQFYDKLESKVKHLLERTHRVCKTEQEERGRIRERLAPKGIGVFDLLNQMMCFLHSELLICFYVS